MVQIRVFYITCNSNFTAISLFSLNSPCCIRTAGETIVSVTYGIDVLPANDPYITALDGLNAAVVQAGMAGAFLVDSIPALKYVPDWMPFAGFKRKAKEWRKLGIQVADMPFEATKRKLVKFSRYSSCSEPG
jgi:hypothetical protein